MSARTSQNPDLLAAVENSTRDLLRLRQWGDTVFVNMPLVMPSGSFATVRVTPHRNGFYVDDGGFAYREAECVGYERSFHRTAGKIAETAEIDATARTIGVSADESNLGRAICDVATASWRIADRIFERITDEDEEELADLLRARVKRIFGASHVSDDEEIVGSSANSWKVSAIVKANGHPAIFQVVGQKITSIYRASTLFRDLADIPSQPKRVAVVKDKKSLGSGIALISQSGGYVLQSDQSDEAYLRVAA